MATPSYERERAAAREDAEAALRVAPLRLFRDRSVERVALPASSAARGLHDLSVSREAALMVVGSAHRGVVGRVLLGSVASRLLHGATCPVAVAPRSYADGACELRTVAVAFDGTEEATLAAVEAGRIALAAGATLRLLAVVDTVAAMYLGVESEAVYEIVRRELDERAQQLVGTLPEELSCELRLLRGPVPRTLLAQARRGVDLLVLGSRAYGSLGSVLLGSVSSQVVHASPCPVLVVPRGTESAAGV